MNKAVFLDRDGTIIVDKHYAYLPETIEFIPDAIEGLQKLQNAGFLLIIITNQSGVAKGLFTEEELKIFNKKMTKMLLEKNIKITDLYYCPHHPEGIIKKYALNCNCRKPKIALFLRAAKDYQIDLSKSYAIGDRIRDCAISLYTNCKGCLISNEKLHNLYDRIKLFCSFKECVEYIIGDNL